jgi:hypothetical protein
VIRLALQRAIVEHTAANRWPPGRNYTIEQWLARFDELALGPESLANPAAAAGVFILALLTSLVLAARSKEAVRAN